MLVKLKTNLAGPDGAWAAGAVIEFDRETATALVDGGYAAAIGAAARETATAPANTEAAAAPKPAKPKPAAARA